MKLNRIVILGALVLAGAPSLAAQSSQEALTALAVRITEKRTQVETLSTDLDQVKAAYNEQLRSLAARKADLEIQLNREKLRVEQLDRDLAEARGRIQSDKTDLGDSLPAAKTVLIRLKAAIGAGIPFQTEGRLQEVENLERLLDEGNLEPGGFLARVWNQLEAEYRLTGDNGLYRQKVTLDGQEQMVEVARLGMSLLYLRTLDDHYGLAAPRDGGWVFRTLPEGDDAKRIKALFDGLRKNLKEGFFPLPNPFFVKGTL